MQKYGGLILFYGIVVLGVILLNIRFHYLNQEASKVPSYVIEIEQIEKEGRM